MNVKSFYFWIFLILMKLEASRRKRGTSSRLAVFHVATVYKKRTDRWKQNRDQRKHFQTCAAACKCSVRWLVESHSSVLRPSLAQLVESSLLVSSHRFPLQAQRCHSCVSGEFTTSSTLDVSPFISLSTQVCPALRGFAGSKYTRWDLFTTIKYEPRWEGLKS